MRIQRKPKPREGVGDKSDQNPAELVPARDYHLALVDENTSRARVTNSKITFFLYFDKNRLCNIFTIDFGYFLRTLLGPGNTKEGSITVLLTSCLTGLD